jgi:hypothetical protein
MRTLLAIVMAVGATFALNSSADAARKARSGANAPYYYAPPPYGPRGQSECERRAQAEDPAGRFAGYPCWARESFGRGTGGGRGG